MPGKKYVNASKSPLGIPGLTDLVKPGEECEIDAETAKIKGVAQFISDEWLVEPSKAAKAAKAEVETEKAGE